MRLAEERRIVREVASAVGLAEGEAGVRAVLTTLARLEPVSIRRISRATELPVPIVASVCGELRKRSVVAQARPAQLTPAGRELFASGALRLRDAATCPTCRGRGIALTKEAVSLVAEIDNLAKRAPPPRFELDQCHCTVETKLRRVLAMYDADALVGRRILLLGDDDLTSLAIDRLVRRHGARGTVIHLGVLDVDPAVVRYVRRELRGALFPVSAVVHDLREPLPPSLRSSFDTVVTDPPYTVPGARLFLSRAAEALDAVGGDVFFSFGSRRPEATYRVQQLIAEIGFAILRLTRDFNQYVGAGILGGTSHLYHLKATRELRASRAASYEGPLYTAD